MVLPFFVLYTHTRNLKIPFRSLSVNYKFVRNNVKKFNIHRTIFKSKKWTVFKFSGLITNKFSALFWKYYFHWFYECLSQGEVKYSFEVWRKVESLSCRLVRILDIIAIFVVFNISLFWSNLKPLVDFFRGESQQHAPEQFLPVS